MNPTELRRKAIEAREFASKLLATAAAEDRELSADEIVAFTDAVGPPHDETPVTKGGHGKAGAYTRMALLMEEQEARIAEARAVPAGRTTTPLTPDDKPTGTYADRLGASLREKYNISAK